MNVNQNIKEALKKAHVAYWRIAEQIGCSENTFVRMMRHELPEDQKQKLLSIIDCLAKEDQ